MVVVGAEDCTPMCRLMLSGRVRYKSSLRPATSDALDGRRRTVGEGGFAGARSEWRLVDARRGDGEVGVAGERGEVRAE